MELMDNSLIALFFVVPTKATLLKLPKYKSGQKDKQKNHQNMQKLIWNKHYLLPILFMSIPGP